MLFKNRSSKIIILGLNENSINIAQKLSTENDVIILYESENISNSAKLQDSDIIIEKIKSNLINELKKHVKDEIIFMSMTKQEEYNIFSANLAKKLNIKKSIALSYSSDYNNYNFNIDLIFNIYQLVIDKLNLLFKDIKLKNIKKLLPAKLNLATYKVQKHDNFCYSPVSDIKFNNSNIIALKREKKILFPENNTKILPKDNLYILYKEGKTNWLNIFNSRNYSKNKLYIFGGTRLSIYIIKYFENFLTPIIIEPDRKQCDRLATKLEKPLILQGKGTDLKLLKEEGLDNNSFFIAISKNDSRNLLSCFGAEQLGCKKVIPLISNNKHKEMVKLLKLNSIIFIPDLIGDFIRSFLRTGFKINKSVVNDLVIKKLDINKYIKLSNKMIKNLDIPHQSRIGAIIRQNKVLFPKQNTKIKKNDSLIVFVARENREKINGYFK